MVDNQSAPPISTNNQPKDLEKEVNTGEIKAIRGQVVEVSFGKQTPNIHDILIVNLKAHPPVYLEVYASLKPPGGQRGKSRFYCLGLSDTKFLHRGQKVINTGKNMQIIAGKELLGRVIDVFGNPHDGKSAIDAPDSTPLYLYHSSNFNEILPPETIMETGIKVIDFFAPILKGGKTGLFGGAGVGKTILLTELINNILLKNPSNKDTKAIYAAVGERAREAQELYSELSQTEAFRNMVMIMGQMGENPAIRSRTAYAGSALAAYFRDQYRSDVLFLIDNIYRFAQAGHELSIMMKSIPSEDGYQPTLTSEMGKLQGRLTSTTNGYITAIEAVFVPSDDMTDYGVRSVFPYLDNFVVLSREVYQEGRLPAVDLLSSNSRALSPGYVSSNHYNTYLQAKSLLEKVNRLEKIVSLVGFSELSYEDQTTYKRAVLLKNYMTQSFFTTQSQTGKKGTYVPLTQTIIDVANIIKGTYDIIHPEKIKFIGSIEDMV